MWGENLVCIAHRAVTHSLLTSEIPVSMKTAKTIPVPEVNNPEDMSKLRPISILPMLARILVKVVYELITKPLEKNGFFSECLHGFVKNHCIDTAYITEYVQRAFDEGDFVEILF
ncbi:corticotropin-releasing factor-binding protein-like protein [Leptotrombidium deliense]|uniref:Corticotropin-releasing factor-binding protein-like protein n=1 Tax=Leptotrombidium deliense TaxID=299467 RepID=A0A443RSV5_9ACAR|nr:corticotropin-releasing factor-binding protein-like protein [Leptotrombidium deliense]